MNNANGGISETGAEPLRTWTAPTVQIHSIELVEATSSNRGNPADGGSVPCRS
jgi:hypothetical protein